MDSGLYSLALAARIHQIPVDAGQLEHRFGDNAASCTPLDIVRAARAIGLKARLIRTPAKRIPTRNLPVIAPDSDGEFFLLAQVRETGDGSRQYLLQSPVASQPQVLSEAEIELRWSGTAILLARRGAAQGDTPGALSFRWFLPSLARYRGLFAEVIVASLFLQLFALATPLFFQVVMDKVLVHRGFTTLNVLAVGFVAVALFDTVISCLRNYLFSHTTSRIDVELGARLFHHLTTLPLAYFEARQAGQTVARVRELDTIRNFITGTALTLVIDLSFTFIFFAVLWYYSPGLTWVVLFSLPCYAALSMTMTPALRRRLEEKFRFGAENQAFLTESVTGIQTIKSQALEPQLQRRWEEQLAHYARAAFRATNLGNIASQLAGLVSKVTTVLIVWLGAHLVIDGALTVGQLVAFNMIAGRISAPILKLAQLWQEFQQAGISLRRIGDILGFPGETGHNANRTTPSGMRGGVSLQNVDFRYRPEGPGVLQGVCVDIEAGTSVALVGHSGSGKSTIAKLLQRLYLPERGRVLIDGQDLSTIDVSWLRRKVGVVQQDSFLFNRSIRENIAIAHPSATLERVMQCAKIAGAHDFIASLPNGYDTAVSEQGSSLSGGQRQRIALARALIGDPRVLILDEATSALDYESERIIQDNMSLIARGRTVVVIAHRLSAVRHCSEIIVLEQGSIIERGSHDTLVARGGHYSRLFQQQNDSAACCAPDSPHGAQAAVSSP